VKDAICEVLAMTKCSQSTQRNDCGAIVSDALASLGPCLIPCINVERGTDDDVKECNDCLVTAMTLSNPEFLPAFGTCCADLSVAISERSVFLLSNVVASGSLAARVCLL
jgi:hypothetical protein